jgi:hypothetical protein
MQILWPAFLLAVVADGLLLTLVHPEDIRVGEFFQGEPIAAHSVGFVALWILSAASSVLTLYLVQTACAPSLYTGLPKCSIKPHARPRCAPGCLSCGGAAMLPARLRQRGSVEAWRHAAREIATCKFRPLPIPQPGPAKALSLEPFERPAVDLCWAPAQDAVRGFRKKPSTFPCPFECSLLRRNGICALKVEPLRNACRPADLCHGSHFNFAHPVVLIQAQHVANSNLARGFHTFARQPDAAPLDRLLRK